MLGSNVPANPSRKGGLALLFRYADDWGCECAQTYITLSRRWTTSTIASEEIMEFKRAWEKSRVKKVIAHVPLLVNLASSNKDIWKKSVERLSSEVRLANQLGVQYLVLHPGFYGDSTRSIGIKSIIKGINNALGKISERNGAKILLETMAGQGTSIGSFEEIATILEAVESTEIVRVCFDTCHVFAAGHDIRGYKGYEKVLTKFDRTLGLDKIEAIHLNDCKSDLGSKVDRHMAIGEGKMGLQVFHALVRDKRFLNAPKIIEIPDRSTEKVMQQLEFLRKLEETSKPIPEPRIIYAQSTLDDVK